MAKKINGKKFQGQRQYKIDIQNGLLDIILKYSLSEHDLITKKSLSNLQKLFNLINERDYENTDVEKYIRIKIVKDILEIVLEKKITSHPMIQQQLLDDYPSYNEIIDWIFDDSDGEMLTDEVNYVNKFVEQRLSYSYMYKYRELFNEIFSSLDREESNMEVLNSKFVATIEKAFTDVKNAKADSECVINDFDLFDNIKSETVVKRTIEELNKPNNKILTGIKKFNEMLNGGLENGRLYLSCGVPKSFKSGTLLNIALWACKYNKNFSLKNPEKKPTVFMLTQENSVRETIDRTYFHLTGKSIKEVSTQEATQKMMKELGLNEVNLIIKYRPNKSISTLDLDAMIDEIEAEGNEVVLLIQDYTKRIRSSNYTSDLRIELGNVSDDLCNIAKARNIPVVSGCQLNREAYKVIEMAIAKGKSDIAKELNASHIGESAMLIENADYAFIINKEENTSTNEEFLSFKLIASRVKAPKVTYFAQRFENGMKLEEDLRLSKSLSYETIGDNLKDFSPNKTREKINSNKQLPDEMVGGKSSFNVVTPQMVTPNTEFEETLIQSTDELIEF